MTDQDRSHPSTLIRQSEILHRPVIDRTTLEELGRVDVLWMFPQVNRVLGVVVKPGWFGGNRLVFKLPQVKTIKAQVVVQGTAEDTTLDKVEKLESLIGAVVWSEGGDRIGTITDCLFDLNSGVIIRYLMVPDGQLPKRITQFTDGLYLISPKQIQSFSRQRVLIADEAVGQLRLYTESLRFKLATMTAQLKQDYWDGATEEWRSLAHHVQSIAQNAAVRVKSLAEKAQSLSKTLTRKVSETVADVSETVTDKVEQVEGAIADENSPWNDPEWVDTMTDTVKTKGQTMVGQVKAHSRPVVDRLKTVQQTVKSSVSSHINTLIDTPAAKTVQGQKRGERGSGHGTENTIDAGLTDEQGDDERLDDLDWGDQLDDLDWDDATVDDLDWDDEAETSPHAADRPDDSILDDFAVERKTSTDPWDDWDSGDVSQACPPAHNPQTSNDPSTTHAADSTPPMADPWDMDDLKEP